MGLTLTVPPATEPLTLAEAKLHLRVTTTDEDALVTSLIQAAREHVEWVTRRALITQTWQYTLDQWPVWNQRTAGDQWPVWNLGISGHEWQSSQFVRLPRSPLVSVTSITYVDGNGVTQTWASSNYVVDTGSLPGKIDLGYGLAWPIGRYQANAITITFVAGYGAAANVPESLKSAMKLLIGNWFEQREATTPGPLAVVPMAVDALIWPYRVLEMI